MVVFYIPVRRAVFPPPPIYRTTAATVLTDYFHLFPNATLTDRTRPDVRLSTQASYLALKEGHVCARVDSIVPVSQRSATIFTGSASYSIASHSHLNKHAEHSKEDEKKTNATASNKKAPTFPRETRKFDTTRERERVALTGRLLLYRFLFLVSGLLKDSLDK